MYDELVERLKEDKSWVEQGTTQTEHEIAEHIQQAADAIEEQQAQIDGWIEQERNALLKSIPKWIPVTERLPEQKKAHYLCLLDDDSMAVVYWSKIPDWASKGEWTWHNPNWKEVTHWMPLPTPSKAEEGE